MNNLRASSLYLALFLVAGLLHCSAFSSEEDSNDTLLLAVLIAQANLGPECNRLSKTYDSTAPDTASAAPGLGPAVETASAADHLVWKYVQSPAGWVHAPLAVSPVGFVLGDMVFAEHQVRDFPPAAGWTGQNRGLAWADDSTRWPLVNGKIQVPYTIDGSANADTILKINQAIEHWEQYSIVDFIARTSETAYVEFVQPAETGNCSANVGYSGTKQNVWLGTSCSTGNAVHEIGHVLGLMHTQQRNDRDSHIIVYEENILSSYVSQYAKLGSYGLDIGRYDVTSIMHYGSLSFAKSATAPTMTTFDGEWIAANRTALTTCDVYVAEQIHTDSRYNEAL